MAPISNISDSRGGGVDSVDGAHVEQASAPSDVWTPTNGEISMHIPWDILPPEQYTVWSPVTETRGGGEAIGYYGLLSCKWGIPGKNINFSPSQSQFLEYLRRGPCHFFVSTRSR